MLFKEAFAAFNFGEFVEWQPKLKIALTLGVCVFAIAVSSVFLFYPKLVSYELMVAEEAVLKSSLTAEMKLVNRLSMLEQRLLSMREAEVRLQEKLKSYTGEVDAFVIFNEMIDAAQLKLEQIESQNLEDRSNHDEHLFKLRLAGSFKSMTEFLDDLHQLRFIVGVNLLKIARHPETEGDLFMEIDIIALGEAPK